MCGFYFSNQHPKFDYDFKDVLQRGIDDRVFIDKDYFAIQSVLPCVNDINFDLYENDNFLFLYTGEIYNYNRKFTCDTEMFFHDLVNGNSISHYNGMYAYVFYNKKTKEIKYGRDKTGQIPLFVYNKDGHFVISNTIKSIVKTTNTCINKNALHLWKQSKHYIFNETPWQNIYSVEPYSVEPCYEDVPVYTTFHNMIIDYSSKLKSASINSGGVDSGLVSKWFGEFQVALNHIGKDFVSNDLDFAYNITEEEWCNYTDEFIEATYLFPYTWSWIGYYILGKKLQGKINILYTGEGADEIFGGYPGYSFKQRTPYSDYFEIDKSNFLVNNKLSDQKYFIPTACMGANLALGCFTIESRAPFLDRRFMNSKQYLAEADKQTLKDYYKFMYKKTPAPKQGFAGFPDEYGKTSSWKDACFQTLIKYADN